MPDAFGRPLPGERAQAVDAFGRPVGGGAPAAAAPSPSGILGTALSYAAPVFDFLSRGQYASAKFFDSTIREGADIFDALGAAFGEAYDPKERLSFSDVIRRGAPDFASNNPTTTSILGFLGDVALDPTSYLGLGFAKAGLQVGGKTLTKVGREVLERAGSQAAGRAGAREFIVGAGLADELAVGRAAQRAADLGLPVTREMGQAGFEAGQRSIREATESQLGPELLRALTPAERAKLGPLADELFGASRQVGPDTTILSRQLTQDEIRETTEQLIARVADLSPDASKALFEKGGARLTLGLPFTKGVDVPGSRAVLNALGLNFVADKVKGLKNLPGITKVVGAFSRFHNLPDEYIKAAEKLNNEFDAAAARVVGGAQRMFKDLSAEERDQVREILVNVQKLTDRTQELSGAPMTSGNWSRLMRDEFARRNLNEKQMAAVAELEQGYKEVMEIERLAGLTGQGMRLFDRDSYDVLSTIPVKQLASTNLLDSPVNKLDVAALYARRAVEARKNLARKTFDETLETIYGTSEPRLLQKIAPRVAADLRYFGDAEGAYENTPAALKFFDNIQGLLKTLYTRGAPSFGPRQLVSNFMSSLLSSGVKSFKALDPRVFVEAAGLVLGSRATQKGLDERLNSWLGKWIEPNADSGAAMRLALQNHLRNESFDDFASGYRLTNVLGESYTGADINRLARENGIVRGMDMTGERAARDLGRQLDARDKGLFDKVKGAVKGYLAIPSVVEDYSRTALFLNGLRMGYSPAQAAQVVNKTLFDYGRGLSRFEQEFVKRLVPFYSYQRFAIPFVLKKTLEKPGDVATINKFADLVGKLAGGDGEDLSPQEREIFGQSYLVEQPRVYRGKDPQGRLTFNVFNSLTPFDVIDMIVRNPVTGAVDFKRTAEKSMLAQVTPFLKVPLEVAANREFFTGRPIERAGGIGQVSDESLAAALPDSIKELVGWEVGRNGKVYINPYLAYSSANVFPFVRAFVKSAATDSPLDAAMQFVFRVGVNKLDPKESSEMQKFLEDRELKDARKELKEASLRRAPDSYAKAKEDYRELMRIISRRRSARAGLQPAPSPAPSQPAPAA